MSAYNCIFLVCDCNFVHISFPAIVGPQGHSRAARPGSGAGARYIRRAGVIVFCDDN